MKFLILASLLCICLIISETSAEKMRKIKKYRKPGKHISSEEDEIKDLKKNQEVVVPPNEGSDEVVDNRVPLMDPCIKVHCGAGRVCQLDSDGEPQCVCIPTCPVETESRRKVCSNYNETWTSDCAIYQQRCLCAKGDPECKGEQYRHIHIEYYGECREMPQCTEEEMGDFPRRMREWLFNIMRDLADRSELSPHYLKLEREAESNMTRRWTNAAIWKFCDLDGFPPDRSVSRHELFPIRAPLMALEHCISPFLNDCDKNNDHKITIEEWAQCLQLDEDELNAECDNLLDNE